MQTTQTNKLLGFVVDGMRPWADVELQTQTVLVPHLMSLAKGFPSVGSQARRSSECQLLRCDNTADMQTSPSFWPINVQPEGKEAESEDMCNRKNACCVYVRASLHSIACTALLVLPSNFSSSPAVMICLLICSPSLPLGLVSHVTSLLIYLLLYFSLLRVCDIVIVYQLG